MEEVDVEGGLICCDGRRLERGDEAEGRELRSGAISLVAGCVVSRVAIRRYVGFLSNREWVSLLESKPRLIKLSRRKNPRPDQDAEVIAPCLEL